MDEGPGRAGRAPRMRTYSIEKHLRRGEEAELAFDVGAGPESGGMAALMREIRAMRAEMGDMRRQLAEVTSATTSAASKLLGATAAPDAPETWEQEALALRIEIGRMVRSLATAKREIAEIQHPMGGGSDDRMTKAASELDEIVSATEQATHTILDASEVITAHCGDILGEIGDLDEIAPRLHDISDKAARIMEACNFQDITGQRITKVVKTLEFIEDRIRTIVADWGRDAFVDLPLPTEEVDPDDESHLLNGPQLQNQGLSQDDIDALFG